MLGFSKHFKCQQSLGTHIFCYPPTRWSSLCLWTHGRADREGAVPAHGTWGGLGREETGGKRQNIPDMFPFSCFFRCLSRLVCWPKHLSHKWHLNGFSLLWMLRTCLCRLEDMLKDLSQYLHLKKQQNKWVGKRLLAAGNVRFVLKYMKSLLGSVSAPNHSSWFPTESQSSLT